MICFFHHFVSVLQQAVVMLFILLENEEYPRDLVNRPSYCSLTLDEPNVLSSLLRSQLPKYRRFCR